MSGYRSPAQKLFGAAKTKKRTCYKSVLNMLYRLQISSPKAVLDMDRTNEALLEF